MTEQTDEAVAEVHGHDQSAQDFWSGHYSGDGPVWSGHPNEAMTEALKEISPGRAVDLGCGEGADVLWLAQKGWLVTGIDISEVALGRARQAAAALGLPPNQVRFEKADLVDWELKDDVDLVSASFFHSPVELDRSTVLRQAANKVAPGGHVLIVSHAGVPPGAELQDDHHHQFLTPDQELAALAVDDANWTVVVSEIRRREAVGRDGRPVSLDDAVLLLRKSQPHRRG